MTWFEQLMGFAELSPEQVRQEIELSGDELISRRNGQRFRYGTLEILSLDELARRSNAVRSEGQSTIREVVGNVRDLHLDPKNADALFQVASQFNLLEMTGPSVTPERGVGIYEHDYTQGPACAMAAGAGTMYRNYFVPVRGRVGQTFDNQINCLEPLEDALKNACPNPWHYRNGYILLDAAKLERICNHLRSITFEERNRLKGLIRIGIQWRTQVTLPGVSHCVSQAYCSALPVAYDQHEDSAWEPFARLILETAYEATLHAAVLNCANTGNRTVYLTLLGGGAFGNDLSWILDSIKSAYEPFRTANLDIQVVSYQRSIPAVDALLSQL